ncbi:MAG: 50S ribosomal protein L6 [Candidatus Aenigmatarchaeota archaeon]
MISTEVKIPENVKVEIDGSKVRVFGEKGELERSFPKKGIKIELSEGKIIISSESERRSFRALIGTLASHIKNMIEGVTKGFSYRLRVVYSHFPITVKLEGDKVLIQNFLGERVPRVAKIVGKTQVKIEGQEIIVSGINLEEVSQTAANIEQACRIVGYDRRKFMDGIFLVSRE